MGYNRSGANRKARLKRRRAQVSRLVQQYEATDIASQGGEAAVARKIRHLRQSMKLRS